MKFLYQYRTRQNQLKSGVVDASSREDAFSVLKSQGIKPCRMEEAPGFFNKLFGKGKRWIAIGLLSLLVGVSFVVSLSLKSVVKDLTNEVEDLTVYEKRSQIYGDPALLSIVAADGWLAVFPMLGDRFLAAYAIPGRNVVYQGKPPLKHIAEAIKRNVEIYPDDYAEVATIKRMVNWMKREARTYVADGGTVEGYVKRLARRQREEAQYYFRIKQELSRTDDPVKWADRNEGLRAMGLPMIERESKIAP